MKKTHLTVEFHKTVLDIWSHSREENTRFHSRINMVNLSYLQEVKCVSSFAEIFTPSLLSNAMNNLPKSMKICYGQLCDHIFRRKTDSFDSFKPFLNAAATRIS